MISTVCIAGKNNIAINICKYILDNKLCENIIACTNKNDIGKNNFQRSFKNFCEKNNVKIVTLDEVYNIENVVFLSLEFDQIIKPHLFKSPHLYNIHFSLLPKYKGMYTSALPILNGEVQTGVTLHKIDRGIDTGDIIAQKSIEINDEMTSQDLYYNYIEQGTQLVRDYLKNLLSHDIKTIPQDHKGSTYFSASSIDYSNVTIDLRKTSFQVLRQINAFAFPAYQLPTLFNHKIYGAQIINSLSTTRAGKIISEDSFTYTVSTIDFDILLKKNRSNDLFEIAKNGDLAQLKDFLSNNYNIHQRSAEGWDIAIIAGYNQQYEFLKFLLDNLNWNTSTKNNNGTTLSMYLMTIASKTNNTKFLTDYLEKYKPLLQEKDYSNKDIFDYAVIYNNHEVIEILNNYKR